MHLFLRVHVCVCVRVYPCVPRVPSTRQSLQAYFDNSWMLTESLFAGLQGEEAFLRLPSHGLRHPLIFYYGHPAALYVNKLRAAGILQVRADSHLACTARAYLRCGMDAVCADILS